MGIHNSRISPNNKKSPKIPNRNTKEAKTMLQTKGKYKAIAKFKRLKVRAKPKYKARNKKRKHTNGETRGDTGGNRLRGRTQGGHTGV